MGVRSLYAKYMGVRRLYAMGYHQSLWNSPFCLSNLKTTGNLDLLQVSLVNFGFTSGFFRIPLNVSESDLNRALPITSAFRGRKGEKYS
jgi:hypothetical protein